MPWHPCCWSGRAHQSFHFACVGDNDRVAQITPIQADESLDQRRLLHPALGDLRLHGSGRRAGPGALSAVDHAKAGCIGYRHSGFWCCMDTFKDKKLLDDMYDRGDRPWEVWRRARTGD